MATLYRFLAVVAVVCLSALPIRSALESADWRSSGRDWASGPAWYVMTTSEYSSYRHLRDEESRRRFIREFWDRRDPLPETKENELERAFWSRVHTADDHFGQDVKPGWKTDRGKLFIMLGPPENYEVDEIPADVWGASQWVYDLGDMSPALRNVLAEALGVPAQRRFVSLKVRGETRGTRVQSGGIVVAGTVLRPTGALPLGELLVKHMPGPEPLRHLGEIMRVPEAIEARPLVNVMTVFRQIPLHARVDFNPGLQARGKGSTT
ncbi:MAG TPA: GWxTD domain-containing protein, partial [Candidatus Polarisedimenticolia bacterium]|nr:GWxTD domain-containing protein [Candidatus Polarisedimenticolia bacterium]